MQTFTVPITVRPLSLLLTGDGRRLVVNDNQGELRLFDSATHRQVGAPIDGVGAYGGPMALTPDGGHLVALDTNAPADVT